MVYKKKVPATHIFYTLVTSLIGAKYFVSGARK
jgi:hypothetical protein